MNPSGNLGSFDHQGDRGQDQRAGERGGSRLSEDDIADQEREAGSGGGGGGESEDTTPVHEVSPWSIHGTPDILDAVNFHFPPFSGSSIATLPWPDETLPAFNNNDTGGEISGLEPFGPQYSRAFNTYQAEPMDIQMPTALPISSDEQSRDMAVMEYGTSAQAYSNANMQISGASDEAIDLDLTNRSAHIEAFNLAKALNAAPRPDRTRDRGDTERPRVAANFGMSSAAEFALSEDLLDKEAAAGSSSFNEENLSVNEIQHRRMQELSELAMELYAHLAANDRKNYQPTSDTKTAAFEDQLVGSVLKSSNTFLTLLTSFSTPATTLPSSPFSPPPSPTPSMNPPPPPNNCTCNSSDGGASPSASPVDQEDDAVMDGPAENSHGRLPAGSSDAPPIDVTTVLQLLTCYLRIIHLHSIMHARILDYMLAFLPHHHKTQHVNAVPPVFPGMQVGGVSLDKFGTFQVELLLQISMHMLDKIELTLGLPEEYRVGKRKRRKWGARGVLEASVSGDFVKCLMREEGWRGKKVESVREGLGNLRRVLKGAVDF